MNRLILLLGLTGFVMFGGGCKKSDSAGSTCSGQYSFQSQVQSIFVNSCSKAGCHDGSLTGPAPLRTYTEVMAGIDQVKVSVQTGRMPQDGPLSASDKEALLCWINSGAPNN